MSSVSERVAHARVQDVLPVLHRLAKHFIRRFRGTPLELDELISHGYLALQKAAHSFDPSFGVPFTAYAWPRMHGAMLTALQKETAIARAARKAGCRALTLYRDEADLLADDERAHRGHLDRFCHDVLAAMLLGVVSEASAQAAAGGGAGPDGAGVSASGALRASPEHALAAAFDWSRTRTTLHACLDQLNEEDRRVIDLHYFEGRALVDLTEELEMSYPTIRRRHQRALRRLGALLRGQRIEADVLRAG